ncbi:MAG: hypothetical protein JWN94_918 [Betaproteobacteria bacterium]|nr:hypothetical protein [Betaproteobacteria bacterium]
MEEKLTWIDMTLLPDELPSEWAFDSSDLLRVVGGAASKNDTMS